MNVKMNKLQFLPSRTCNREEYIYAIFCCCVLFVYSSLRDVELKILWGLKERERDLLPVAANSLDKNELKNVMKRWH